MYTKVANTASTATPSIASTRTDALFGSKAPPTRDFAPDIGFPGTNMNGPDQLRKGSFEMIDLGNGKWRINGIEVHGKNLKEAMENWGFASGTEPRPQ